MLDAAENDDRIASSVPPARALVKSARLADGGISLLNCYELDRAQREAARAFYDREIFPGLTTLAVAPGHPFPHISNPSLNLAVAVEDPPRGRLFARIKVPAILPRLIPVPAPAASVPRTSHFAWLEQA